MSGSSTLPNVTFSYLEGVELVGCSATITLDGNFARTSNGDHTIIPFDIFNSKNFVVRGFTIEGNVAVMSRSAGVTEGTSYGVRTGTSSDYSITDMTFHGLATDGLVLGIGASLDDSLHHQDSNAYLRNITSANNGRNGLSVCQVNGALIKDSFFEKSGVTGSYGGHSPMAGVDVEPDYGPDSVVEGEKTGGIVFDNVSFTGNLGSQFTAAYPASISDVSIRNSAIAVQDPAYFLTVIMTVSDGLIENTTVDTGPGEGYVDTTYCGTWESTLTPQVKVLNSQITTEGYGLLALSCTGVAHDIDVTIDGVTITGKPEKPWDHYMPYINQPNTDFINNTVFVSKGSYYSWSGGYNVESLVQDARLTAHNTWKSDLVAGQPAGPSGAIAPTNAAFWVSYNGGLVAQDAYQSGTVIYPMGGGTWTTGTPYNHYSQ